VLGLSQIPYQNQAGFGYIGFVEPIIPGSPVGASIVPNVAPEHLFIQFMNPSMSKATGRYYFDRLILTVSMNVPGMAVPPTIAQVNARFKAIESRLGLLSTFYKGSSFFVPKVNDQYLPFGISFDENIGRVQTIDNTIAFSVTNNANKASTLCKPQVANSTTKIDTCPQPTKTLLSSSPFWSTCPPPPTQESQTLSPVCIDHFGVSYNNNNNNNNNSFTTWCQQGWFNYPAVTSVASCSTQKVYEIPDISKPIQWSSTYEAGYVTEIDPTTNPSVTIGWLWVGDFDPTLTVDVLYYTHSGAYSTVLTSVLATNGAATVRIPENTTDKVFEGANIRLRCTQYAKYQTPKELVVKLRVNFVNKCTATCDGLNKQCIRSTGQCVCLPGFTQSTTSSDCVLPCTGLCASPEFCVVESPNVCGKCNPGTLPPLCSTPELCNNDPVTGLNPQCSKHGFIDVNSAGSCVNDQCKCVAHQFWGGDKCQTCLLIPTTDPPSASQCVLAHTDVAKTIRDIDNNGGLECGSCACLPGYSGQYCEISAIRGDVTYVLDGEPTLPPEDDGNDDDTNTEMNLKLLSLRSLSLFNPNQLEDPNGFHFVSEQGRIVLESDMALSLGLDSDAVSIAKIVQVTQPSAMKITAATTTTTITYNVFAGQTTNLGDLTNAWNGMQKDYPQLPVGNTEASGEVGSANNVGSAQQPDVKAECDPATHKCDCTDEEKLAHGGECPLLEPSKGKSSTVGIIVGVIVGGAVVIGLFVGTIVFVKWAKKNQRCCFKPEKRRNEDDLELTMSETNSVATSNRSTTASSSTPAKSAISGSATAVDLIEITDHGEDLPSGWSKHKHAVTGQVMYVNQIEMKSQKHSPLDNAEEVGNGW
jgi:hypothetical protein